MAKFVPLIIHAPNGGIWLHDCSGYNAGFNKPHYPVPATLGNAYWADYNQWLEDQYYWLSFDRAEYDYYNT